MGSMDSDQKIIKIQEYFKNWKFIVDDNVPDYLQPLRNQVLYLIGIVDIFLDVLIGMNITYPIKDKLNFKERLDIGDKVGELIEPMNFGRKLEVAKNSGLIKQPLYNYIVRANNLRNALSHPLARNYIPKIKILGKKSNQLKEWENLKIIAEAIDELKTIKP